MKISYNRNWLTVDLQKNIDFGKGIIVNLPNNKKISIFLTTRETACVHYDRRGRKGEILKNIDSFIVNDRMDWYDQNDV